MASWYDFAVAIAEEATVRGLLAGVVDVLPIATEDYPTPARRPKNSRLDCSRLRDTFSVALAPWEEALAEALAEHARLSGAG